MTRDKRGSPGKQPADVPAAPAVCSRVGSPGALTPPHQGEARASAQERAGGRAHSARSASCGSTRVARSAGTSAAASVTSESIATAPSAVGGSDGATWYRSRWSE